MLVQPRLPRTRDLHRNKDITVCWANVGKSSPCHIAILEIAFNQTIDVICVQEPFTCDHSRTSTHPGYKHYAPVDAWEDPATREAERPRVMTYIRKGAGLQVQQRESLNNRDLIWLNVGGYSVLNVYRQPRTPEVIEYVTHLMPPDLVLIGGDFNVRHHTFEPGSTSANGGGSLSSMGHKL
jgi:exonuclease III